MTAQNTALAAAHLELKRAREQLQAVERENERLRVQAIRFRELIEAKSQAEARLYECWLYENLAVTDARRDLERAERQIDDLTRGPDPWDEEDVIAIPNPDVEDAIDGPNSVA